MLGSLFGDRGAAMARANEAYKKAEALELLMARAVTVIETHSTSCDKFRESLEKATTANREELIEWRRGVGVRFDSQDNQMRRIFIGVIGVLLTVVGYLLDHFGVFQAIKP